MNRYPASLGDLKPYYFREEIPKDGWGRPFEYERLNDGQRYTLTSYGRDGVAGPTPTRPWKFGEQAGADIVFSLGLFVQAPQ